MELNVDINEIIDFKHPTKCWTRGKVISIDKTELDSQSLIKINSNDHDYLINFPSSQYNLTTGKCGTKFTDEQNPCPTTNSVPNTASNALRKQKMECNSSRFGDC